MKHGSHMLIRYALGRQSTSTALLLMVFLLHDLVQPIASQVYVNSSSYEGNTPAREQANQTQESLKPLPSHPTGWTEGTDKIIGPSTKSESVTDRIASAEVNKQGGSISKVQTEALNITVDETSTQPLKMHVKVYLTTHSPSPNNRTNSGRSQMQHFTVTTVPTQKSGGYSEKETATFIPLKQDSGGTAIAKAVTVHKKAINDTNNEGSAVSAVLLPTVINLVKTPTDSNNADQAQTSSTSLTTVSTTHIESTVGLVTQAKASTATLTNKKPSMSVYSPVIADRMNTTEADLGGG